MSSKQKSFGYKVARWSVDGTRNLQRALVQAFALRQRARDREWRPAGDADTVRLINNHRDYGANLCGVMFSFTRGQNQNIVGLDANAVEYPVEQLAPPLDDARRRTEFIEGLLYFCIHNNHIVLAGSQAIRSEQFEDYINWLLAQSAQILPAGEILTVADPLRPDYSQRTMEKVKSIVIRGHPEIGVAPAPSGARRQTLRFRPKGRILDAINLILREYGARVPNITFSRPVAPEDIEVNLEVKWKRSRRSTDGATPFIDSLCNAFRHVDNPPVDFVFRDGKKITGSSFKVSQSRGVDVHNGIPVAENVFRKMSEWLDELLSNGSVLLDGQ